MIMLKRAVQANSNSLLSAEENFGTKQDSVHPYAMPVQVMDYSTKHRCIQSALRPPRQIYRRCCEIAVRSLQCNMFNSETFLGVVNVNVTNCMGNSHYFVDKSGCSEKLKAS